MKSRRLPVAFTLAAALLHPCPARAQVYHWEDTDGTVHFSNGPDRLPGSPRPEGAPLPPPAVAAPALGRLGISTLNAPRAMIHGVTGSGQASVVQVSSVQVGEARVGPLGIVAHDVAIAQADGLLGRDFLEQFTVTIDAVEQTVTLSSR